MVLQKPECVSSKYYMRVYLVQPVFIFTKSIALPLQNSCHVLSPAKSYALGWYSDKNLDIDAWTTPFCGRLVGVAKYATIAGDEKVVLKISDTSTNYYIGYNHAIGFHDGTNEAVNQVTIVSQNATFGSWSYLEARLSEGDQYRIRNIFGSGKDLSIKVIEIDTGVAGFAAVEVVHGTQVCPRPFL